MSELFNNVKVGDTVHYLTPQGQNGKGKVVIKHESGSHVVINRGKGQPQVVNDKNYVKHERGGKVVGALLSRVARCLPERMQQSRKVLGMLSGQNVIRKKRRSRNC